MVTSSLHALMNPGSVGVIGASPKVGSRGHSSVRNLVEFGFKGPIYPIHPSADEIFGLKAYHSLAKAPAVPDVVIVALSAEKIVPVLTEAAAAGVKAAVVFASGFAETDEKGRLHQDDLAALAARTGMLVCGPNCLGLANIRDRISLYSSQLPEHIVPGGVGVVSHSGSGAILLSNLRRFGFSYIISSGNSASLDIADYLEFLAVDPSTRVAAVFLESIRDPERFATAALTMRQAGKPIVALKVGRSIKGAAATAAHTGSLGGADAVYQDFFARCGVIAVDDLDELVESLALAVSADRKPQTGGIGVINVSGGEIALTCDIAERHGVALPELSASTIARLNSVLPDFGSAANPLDATGNAVSDLELYRQCIEAVASDPGIGIVAVSQDAPIDLGERQAARYARLAKVAADVSVGLGKPLVFYSNLAAGIHPKVAEPLIAAGVPALQGARASLLALKRWWETSVQPELEASQPRSADGPQPKWTERLRSGVVFSETEAKAFLADHGIPVPREFFASSEEQAVAAAKALSFPVALKVDSPDIAHKTEVGGVRLGLTAPEEVAEAFRNIMTDVQLGAPAARINGVSVQEMVSGGIEVIAGLSRQPPFGLSLTVGAGGVFVELMQDAVLSLLPLDRAACHALLSKTRVATLLRGYRGGGVADIEALVDLLTKFAAIGRSYSEEIEAFELNPISVLADGKGVRALDALLIPRAGKSPIGGGAASTTAPDGARL